MKNLGSSCTTGPTNPGTASLRSLLIVAARTLKKQGVAAAEEAKCDNTGRGSSGRKEQQGKGQEGQGRLIGGRTRQNAINQQRQKRPSVRHQRLQQRSLIWPETTSSSSLSKGNLLADLGASDWHFRNC
jgi:hypothetical protein